MGAARNDGRSTGYKANDRDRMPAVAAGNALIFLQLTSAILASWGQFRYIGRVEWLAGRCLAMHLYLHGVLEPAK